MQDLIAYVDCSATLGVCRDIYGVKSVEAPTIIRGGRYMLRLRLFGAAGSNTAYPLTALNAVTQWEWAMDSDFDDATAHKIIGDNANITVAETTVPIDDGETAQLTCSEVAIPLLNTNSEALTAWLGKTESLTTLHGELAGYDDDANLVFLLQIKNFTVRNRITPAGEPEPDDPEYYTAAQVRALLAAGFEVETRENAGNHEFRFRSESAGGDWSEWIVLPPGADGADGADGAPGANGAGLQIDQFGLLSERPESPETSPFCYFATDTNLAYFWDGAEWSTGVTVTGPEGQPGANGTDGAVGPSIVSDPAVEFTFMNETYGRCVQLDATTPTMNFAAPVWDVKKIRLRVVSANPDVTGNIVLVPRVNSVELEAHTVAVGGTPSAVEITLPSAQSGLFSLRRDYSSDNDTLQDGEPVTALILNTELVIAHD